MKEYTINITIKQFYTEDEYEFFKNRMEDLGLGDNEVIVEILKQSGILDDINNYKVITEWRDV